MRLVDRLFSFWRLPAWTDPVQVLLWLLGWSFLAYVVAKVGLPVIVMARGMAITRDLFGWDWLPVIFVVLAVFVIGWTIIGCWFISEAYNTWREGHRYGRQWTIVIAGFLLFGLVPYVLPWSMHAETTFDAAVVAVRAAFGVALLVACFTTRPPSPTPAFAA